MRRLPTSVRPPSVVCPIVISRKLNKRGIQLLCNTIRKLASLILLPHSDPAPSPPPGGGIFWFQIQNMCVTPQLLSTEQTVVSPPVLSTVVNRVRRSKPVVHNHRLLCSRRQSRTGGGPASFRSAMFLYFITICHMNFRNSEILHITLIA